MKPHSPSTQQTSGEAETLTAMEQPRAETGLAQRLFTKQQADFAAKVANDIHEGIDCYESREDLRMVVSYWSCVASDSNNARISRDSQAVINAIKTLRVPQISTPSSQPQVTKGKEETGGWIKTADRPPTKEDGGGTGCVFVRGELWAQEAEWNKVAAYTDRYPFWMPIPPVPKD